MREILAMSGRILVMRDGRIAGELQGGEATQEKIMNCALGEPYEATAGKYQFRPDPAIWNVYRVDPALCSLHATVTLLSDRLQSDECRTAVGHYCCDFSGYDICDYYGRN